MNTMLSLKAQACWCEAGVVVAPPVRGHIRRGTMKAAAEAVELPPYPEGSAVKIEENFSAQDRARLEITLPSALEMCRLGLATMIDIRQTFEIEMKGAIPDTVHIPMFEVKRMLGHALTENEQEVLDAGQPKEMDAQTFFTMINKLHHSHDHLLLCICNSGRRSLTAAALLRSLGYPKALSVAGGFQAWKKLQPDAAEESPAS